MYLHPDYSKKSVFFLFILKFRDLIFIFLWLLPVKLVLVKLYTQFIGSVF